MIITLIILLTISITTNVVLAIVLKESENNRALEIRHNEKLTNRLYEEMKK